MDMLSTGCIVGTKVSHGIMHLDVFFGTVMDIELLFM